MVTQVVQEVQHRPVEVKGTQKDVLFHAAFSETQHVFLLYSTIYFCTYGAHTCTNAYR